jgi:hypothetical protein
LAGGVVFILCEPIRNADAMMIPPGRQKSPAAMSSFFLRVTMPPVVFDAGEIISRSVSFCYTVQHGDTRSDIGSLVACPDALLVYLGVQREEKRAIGELVEGSMVSDGDRSGGLYPYPQRDIRCRFT